MKLHRFYIEERLREGEEIAVTKEGYVHQWLSVFRFTSDDRILLFNGDGFQFHATFIELHKKKAVLTIGEKEPAYIPQRKVHLYLAVIKKDLFEFAAEKATELGVSSITPVISERVQVKNLNMERLQKIAIEASEQCGRGDVPKVEEAIRLEDIADSAEGMIVCDMNGATIKSFDLNAGAYRLFIGPEGGWSDEERELFKAKDAQTISLGPTTLRAETAAIVATALMFHLPDSQSDSRRAG